MSREFLAFAVAGGVAAGVNWVSRIGFSLFAPLEAAVVLAYLVGMTTAYTLNRLFVFSKSGRTVGAEYTRFALVNLVALGQVFIVTVGLAEWVFPAVGFTWRPAEVAHALGVASPIVTSYLGHRHFTFSKAHHG